MWRQRVKTSPCFCLQTSRSALILLRSVFLCRGRTKPNLQQRIWKDFFMLSFCCDIRRSSDKHIFNVQISFFIWAKFLGHKWEISSKDWKMFSLTFFFFPRATLSKKMSKISRSWSSTQNVFTSETFFILNAICFSFYEQVKVFLWAEFLHEVMSKKILLSSFDGLDPIKVLNAAFSFFPPLCWSWLNHCC